MMSSESDGYDATDSSVPYRRGAPPRRRGRRSSASTADQIDSITSDLKETNRNLRSVDGLLEQYRDTNREQSTAIDRLRENLARSTDKLRNERVRRRSPPLQRSNRSTLRASDLESSRQRRYRTTSPLKDYRSEVDTASTRTNIFRPSVRFDDNIDEIHEIHQNVRDLSSDNLRLGEELDREIQRRSQTEMESRRSLLQLSENLRRTQHMDRGDKSSARVEKRLRDIQDELRQQRRQRESRDTRSSREDRTQASISAELREAVKSQSQQQDRELRDRLLQAEAEKQRLSSQLENAQRKLDQSEGTNTALSSQLDDVHDRLAKSDHNRSQLVGKLSTYQDALEEEGLPLNRHARRERKLIETQEKQDSHRQKLEMEIDSLRTQLGQANGLRELDQTRKELQRSEKQRYQLSEHLEKLNQELEDKERHQTKFIRNSKRAVINYGDRARAPASSVATRGYSGEVTGYEQGDQWSGRQAEGL
ncbi:centrosomal protein of 128 kDa-like isoform X2 [Amphiura filiformis]|uniref:centrosomal protein of 128 kDa-like isoform X2 n=1 Tax=Amphiura filiformis TaxID=82378 RepID=UPI003B224CFE